MPSLCRGQKYVRMNKFIQIVVLIGLLNNVLNHKSISSATKIPTPFKSLMAKFNITHEHKHKLRTKVKNSRCSLFLTDVANGIRKVDVLLNNVNMTFYDRSLHQLNMLIDDRIVVSMFELDSIYAYDMRRQVEGIYYDVDGMQGTLKGMCIW